jgi:Na+-translocating ferredoxin:NAD+ oxidoreductase RnfG subunit
MWRSAALAALVVMVCLAAGSALGVAPESAKPAAQGQALAGELDAMRSVLPDAGCGVYVRHRHAQPGGDTLTYCRGYRNADTTGLTGYVVRVRGRGYNGQVETVAGVDVSGRIVGLKVVSQRETPGLGEKIAQVKPTKSGNPGPARIAITFDGPAGESRCLVVGIRDAAALALLEKAAAGGDTAQAAQLAPRALAVSDTTVLSDRRLILALAGKLTEALRDEAVPWWQAQFVGKGAAQLVLSRQKDDVSIQGISGATISSRAVVEPLRAAITQLEQAVGGFEETPK